MNLEKSYLTDDEKGWCFSGGELLAQFCLDGSDGNKNFHSVAAKLSPENRKRLLDEMVFYKMFFVDSYCQRNLDSSHYKFLLAGMSKTLHERLSAENAARSKNELIACSKIPLNEFTMRRLAEQAGVSIKTFDEDSLNQLQLWLESEMDNLRLLRNEMVKLLNLPPSERGTYTLNIAPYISKKPARPVTTKPARPNPPKPVQPAPTKNLGLKLLGLATVAVIGFAAFNYNLTPHDTSPAKVSTPSTTQTSSPPSTTSKLTPDRIAEKIPAPKKITPVAKIGVVTGYVSYPLLNDEGLCEFTIDNTRNDMPVYVRIWDVESQIPVRAFTIAEGDSFTAYNLSPGTYEVRYKELYENDAPPFGSKSEPTILEQHETYSGTSYSVVELTLYKVVNGNTTTTRIDADDV